MITPGSSVKMIKMAEILADDDFNCRGQISLLDVVDLAKDIERQGLIQPIMVCALAVPIPGKQWRLLAGFRRFKAHTVLKRTEIEAVVKDKVMEETDARLINLAENLQRKDLTILQEAKAIQPLITLGLGEQKIAERLGRSRGWVQIRNQLLRLPNDVQKEVEAGIIGQSNIRTLYSINKVAKNPDTLYAAVRKIKGLKAKGVAASQIRIENEVQKRVEKRPRNKHEIGDMLADLTSKGFYGLHTRALAWCAGNLSSDEFYGFLEAEADAQGINYTRPPMEDDYETRDAGSVPGQQDLGSGT